MSIQSRVLDNALSVAEDLTNQGGSVVVGIVPPVVPDKVTTAISYMDLIGKDDFERWVGGLSSFRNRDLYNLEMLLGEIPNYTPHDEIPFKVDRLIEDLLKLDIGKGEAYITTRVKSYFGLNNKEADNLVKQLKDARKRMSNKNKIANRQNSKDYFVDEDSYLCQRIHQGEMVVPRRLANFDAEIEKEIIEDNGAETERKYLVSGKTKDFTLSTIEIPASSFNSMSWIHNWGTNAVIEPGSSTKDYLRHAIQVRSNPTVEYNFAHTGWRIIGKDHNYFSANGAIGDEKIQIKLSREIERYALPLHPKNEDEAVKSSLSLLDIGKSSITYPLFGFTYLAPLTSLLKPMPNFSLYLYGETGTFKTTLAVLALCHFGDFEPDKLPSFDDTANSLEKRAFILKDVPMLLDDYYPSSRKADADSKESTAQRLIRSFSNRTGRARLNADSSDKGRYEPRGILMITAEEMASVQSTIARLAVIEINKGDIDRELLSRLQEQTCLLPHAMSSYIHWLKENIFIIKDRFIKNLPVVRKKVLDTRKYHHHKLAEQVAFLYFSIDTALRWMQDGGFIESERAHQVRKDAWSILLLNAEYLDKRIKTEDPVEWFLEIITTLFVQDKIRFKGKDSNGARQLGVPEAELVGYYDDDYFYFIPTAVWNIVGRYCRSEGTHFPVKRNTLYRLLRERKIIVTKGNENIITERIDGKPRRTLKVLKDRILPSEDEISDE